MRSAVLHSSHCSAGVTLATMTLATQKRFVRKELFEGPMDLRPGEKNMKKGPPVAHSLPVYKTAHKLNNSVRWKNANLITNVAGGKDYRLRETQGEGTFDETGMYRDWLYGDERRYANYCGIALGGLAIFLFFYTMNIMGKETWDIPAPVLASQKKRLAREQANGDSSEIAAELSKIKEESVAAAAPDALATLKRPTTITKPSVA